MNKIFWGNNIRWDAVKSVLIGENADDGGLIKQFKGKARLGLTTFTAYANLEEYPNPNYDPNDPNSFAFYPPYTTIPAENACPRLDVDVAPALDPAAEIEASYRTLTYGRPENLGLGADTPTGEAVSVVAKRLASVEEKGAKVIVLATDGRPDTCEIPAKFDIDGLDLDNDGDFVDAWEQGHELGLDKLRNAVEVAYDEHGIKTYVISVGGDLDNEFLQGVANLGIGRSAELSNVNSDGETIECHELEGSTGNAAPCWIAKGDGATDSLRDAISSIIQLERTCIIDLNGKLKSADALCEGVVKLGDKVLACNNDNGFKAVDLDTIELTGTVCETFKNTNKALDANWPCGTIQSYGTDTFR